jgi:flagellar biosynthesis/type III secretory pathway protein FliH
LKKGGLLYRVSPQVRYDRQAQAELPERLKESLDRVNGWVERERRSVTQEAEALAHRQEIERAELERKIEDARKLGEWREREQTHTPGMQAGRGEGRSQGQGLGQGQSHGSGGQGGGGLSR